MIKEPILCGRCSADVAEDATACKYCGANFKGSKIRAIIKHEEINNMFTLATLENKHRLLTMESATIKNDFVGELVVFKPGDHTKNDFIKDLLVEKNFMLIDTVSRFKYEKFPCPVAITDALIGVNMLQYEKRVTAVFNTIKMSGDRIVISNWNDIQEMLTNREAETLSPNPGLYMKRNKLLHELCVMLREKKRAIIIVNARQACEGGNMVDKWKMPGWDKLQYMFKVDWRGITQHVSTGEKHASNTQLGVIGWLESLQEMYPELKREHANIYEAVKTKFLEMKRMIVEQAVKIHELEHPPKNEQQLPECKKCVIFLSGGKDFGSNVLCDNCPTAKIEKKKEN